MKTKVLTLLSLAVLFAACSTNSSQATDESLKAKKAELKKLKQEIEQLEETRSQNSTSGETKFRVPVSLKEIKPEPFNHFIEITGKLEAEEDAFISPEMNGQIKKVHIEEGEFVKKGQVLVSLNTSLIQTSITEVKTGLELAERMYKKQKELWDQKIGSEIEFLQAKNNKEQAEARLASLEAQLDMASIKAPFDGVVETIMMKEGELASPGRQLIQMLSLNKLKLYGNISERYITSIREGEEVLINFPDVEGLQVSAPIFRVGNVIDNASRTFLIEVKIDNVDGKLKPNMYSTININDFSAEDAFVIPSFVIKQDTKGSYIYIADLDEKTARKRYVKTGLSYKDKTMLLEGVSENDRVVIKGFSQVSDGVGIDLR